MVNRKIGTVFTTIAILWEDKDEFRKYAKLVKNTKTGPMYESDSILFKRMLELYKQHNQAENSTPNKTYPRKITSPVHDQPS